MNKFTILVAVVAIIANVSSANLENGVRRVYSKDYPAFHAKFVQKDGHCTILSLDWVRKYRGFQDESEDALIVKRKAAFQPLADTMQAPMDNSQIVTIYGRREDNVRDHIDLFCKTKVDLDSFPLKHTKADPVVRKIVDSGDQANRIDVVFMGDGYTLSEEQEFFDDMERLTNEMFAGVTFKSYLPLFNIWAIYVESTDSGIGYDGPKNTPFELYREAGQLRGIYPGNANNARTICRLTGTSGCDYPSIIGNDDYYGGLGGEFVIRYNLDKVKLDVVHNKTRRGCDDFWFSDMLFSIKGHNFVDVGEEYDNGYVYSGVNAASSVASLGWGHWLSGTKREEKAIYRMKEYPWHDLSQGSQTLTFTSDGTYARWYMLVSVSAAGEADSLEFELDGEILPWTSTGFDDREFYSWSSDTGLSSGSHRFVVRSKTASTNPDVPRMICSVNLHEFGNEEEFHMDNNYVSAYPTWDYYGYKSFRPTNAGCLMRNMTHNMLCDVCREGMWYQFFQTVSLIDSVDIGTAQPGEATPVTLNTLKLAHLRPPGNEIEGEELKIRWFHNQVEQTELLDLTEIMAADGNWRVEADFITTEVRNDPTNLLHDSATFTI